MNKHTVLKIICFTSILIITLVLLEELLVPTWMSWNNDDTIKEFYTEPDNTIQVLFLGTSQVVNGISSSELYNHYGLCAYSLASEQQPLLSSYFWLKEANRFHQKSLNTVVLDISFLMYADESKESLQAFNEKALAHMRFSPVKVDAINACSKQYDSFDFVENIIPLLRYHTRWKYLSREDFKGMTNSINKLYTRGQNVSYSRTSSTYKASDILKPCQEITETSNYSAIEYESIWSKENLFWFKKIVEYCKENNLNLVLTKLPKIWNDRLHDACQYLARAYQVPFLDLNDSAVLDKIGYTFPLDNKDSTHANIYGAKKLTLYIGDYLINHYPYEDVRINPTYDFMKDQYQQYYEMYVDSWLQNVKSLKAYCKLIDKSRYTILMATKGEMTRKLSEEDRLALSDLGFSCFSDAHYEHTIAGVKSNNTVVANIESDSFRDRILIDGWFDDSGNISLHSCVSQKINHASEIVMQPDEEDAVTEPIKGYSCFSIYCGGRHAGKFASILIHETEFSENRDGINFVIYNNKTHTVVDTSTFEPYETGARRSSDYDPVDEYRLLLMKSKDN